VKAPKGADGNRFLVDHGRRVSWRSSGKQKKISSGQEPSGACYQPRKSAQWAMVLEAAMKPDEALIAHRKAVVRTYCTAWGEPDASTRLQLLQTCFEESGTYTDPNWHQPSLTDLQNLVNDIHRRLANVKIVQRSDLQTYRNVGKFEWDLVRQDGTVHLRGVDFVTFSPTGKLQSVVGFFDSH
jgi:hypothetical protein